MLDGPGDLNRLRMAMIVLATCGKYLDKGAYRRRLDVYFVYLMRYITCKELTIDVDHAISELMRSLRPKLVRPRRAPCHPLASCTLSS